MNFVEFEPGEIKITTKNGYPQGWDHQYNGVACSHVTIQCKLVTLGYSQSKYFNPSWWYRLYHRIDPEGLKFVIEGVGDYEIKPVLFRSEQEYLNWERHLLHHPGKIYHSQLAQLIEAQLDTLNPAYRQFRILGELTEAYLEVSFERMGRHEHGFVLWENCD